MFIDPLAKLLGEIDKTTLFASSSQGKEWAGQQELRNRRWRAPDFSRYLPGSLSGPLLLVQQVAACLQISCRQAGP